jgi:hypothetical protein
MHFKCLNPTKQIVFHSDTESLELDPSSLEIETSDQSNKLTASKNIQYDLVRDFAAIEMNKACKKGQEFTLSLSYKGKILTVLYGFYKSSYLNTEGQRT